MSNRPAETTKPADRIKDQAIRAAYKANRTTNERVVEKSNRAWHHELDDLLSEALHRDE